MRPWLLLDVDGVLNAAGPGHTEAHVVSLPPEDLPRSPFINRPRSGQPLEVVVRLNPEHRQWLVELAEHFELGWASTWEELANTYISPLLGLPELPVVALSDEPAFYREVHRGQTAGWKWRSIERFIELRPVAFIDDGGRILNEGRGLRDPLPTLVIVPDHGLSRSNVDSLVAFAQEASRLPDPELEARPGAAAAFLRVWRNTLVREMAELGVSGSEARYSGREVYEDDEFRIALLVDVAPDADRDVLVNLARDLSDLLGSAVSLQDRARTSPDEVSRWQLEGVVL